MTDERHGEGHNHWALDTVSDPPFPSHGRPAPPRVSTVTKGHLLTPFLIVRTVIVDTKLGLVLLYVPTETVGLLGTGAQDVHLDFHTASEL